MRCDGVDHARDGDDGDGDHADDTGGMTASAKVAGAPAPALEPTGRAEHGRKRRRKSPPCSVPGCGSRPLYTCSHCAPDPGGHVHEGAAGDDGGGGGISNGGGGGGPHGDIHWFCKVHRCEHCVRIAEENDDDVSLDGAVRPPPSRPVDAARIADTARAALARVWQDGGAAADRHIVYAFQTILEMCGPDHGEVHMCACGHPLSSHHAGFGRCVECPDDSPCRAMRRRDGNAAPTAASAAAATAATAATAAAGMGDEAAGSG